MNTQFDQNAFAQWGLPPAPIQPPPGRWSSRAPQFPPPVLPAPGFPPCPDPLVQRFLEAQDPADLLSRYLDPGIFNKFVGDCLAHLSEKDFRGLYFGLPRHLRAVAYELPPGVTADVKALAEPQRPAMYLRLADLRRERCLNVSDTAQQHNWANQSWDLVPMSKTCKTHFFELMRLVPIHSNDPTVWGQVVSYLKKCPAKNDRKTDLSAHVDANSLGVPVSALRTDNLASHAFTAREVEGRDSGSPPGCARRSRSRQEGRRPCSPDLPLRGEHRGARRRGGRSRRDGARDSGPRSPSPSPPGRGGEPRREAHESRHQRHSRSRSRRSRRALRDLAVATPKSKGRDSRRGINHDHIRARFDTDTANLSGSTFIISKDRKYKKKSSVAAALKDLQDSADTDEALTNLTAGYVRKLNKLVGDMPRTNKHWKDLKKTAAALNIDVAGRWKNEDFIELLSRLRALDLFESPPS